MLLIYRVMWRLLIPVIMRCNGVVVGKGTRFYGVPLLAKCDKSTIIIGKNSTLCSVSIMTALGLSHSVVLRTLFADSVISIGDDTGISGGTICAAQRVTIGDRCLIGANVTIVDTDFHTENPTGRHKDSNIFDVKVKPVSIEDDVFIGTGSIILKGVRIGRNSIIGAHSVVVTSIPANAIAAGNPAKVIRFIDNVIK